MNNMANSHCKSLRANSKGFDRLVADFAHPDKLIGFSVHARRHKLLHLADEVRQHHHL